LVNEREAARLLGICPKSVWLRTYPRGTLRSVRIGSRVLYNVETLRAWVAEQEAAQAAAVESAAQPAERGGA
ncbi:MAG: helix-turn-helix domain-containing protein, partial [Pirellulales bacterium]